MTELLDGRLVVVVDDMGGRAVDIDVVIDALSFLSTIKLAKVASGDKGGSVNAGSGLLLDFDAISLAVLSSGGVDC